MGDIVAIVVAIVVSSGEFIL